MPEGMETERPLVVHDTSDGDITQALRRLVRQQPDSVEMILVTHRATRLPVSLARRFHLLRERTPQAAARRAGVLAAEGASVITTAGARDRGAVTISACMIVKDEEDVLGACLEAVAPFVDELVVYDTGSSDSTTDIARRAGATVVEGFWDGDFAAARNRALHHCTSTWVLTVDADEVVDGDPAELRDFLRAETADVVIVRKTSTSWSGATEGVEEKVPRLARRGRTCWEGRIHEQVVGAAGSRDLRLARRSAPVHMTHSGYHVDVMREKGKVERNLEISRQVYRSVDPGDPRRHAVIGNYGRSLFLAGRDDEALRVCSALRDVHDDATVVLNAGRVCVAQLVVRHDLGGASGWLDHLENIGESRGNVALARARIALASGDVEAAQEHVDSARSASSETLDLDANGVVFDPTGITTVEVAVALARGDSSHAVEELTEQADEHPDHVDMAQLIAALDAAELPLADFASRASARFLDASLRKVARLTTATALRWCEAFRAAHPADHRPVVAGCVFAASADLADALVWSGITRAAGLPQLCPLRLAAGRSSTPAVEQALLWALLADSFGEPDALDNFHGAVLKTSDDEIPELTRTMSELAPSLARGLLSEVGPA